MNLGCYSVDVAFPQKNPNKTRKPHLCLYTDFYICEIITFDTATHCTLDYQKCWCWSIKTTGMYKQSNNKELNCGIKIRV